MLPKKNRADKKAVERIFKEGRFLNFPNLTFKYLRSNGKDTKISFIAPKNIAKLAVKRNLLRRRGYAVLRKYINDFPIGLLGVFLFKKYQDDLTIIESEVKNTLEKIKNEKNNH